MKPNLLSQRTHDAITTSLWRQNDVAKSFWRRNGVISTRIRNCALSHVMASAQMLTRICINSEEITVLITGAATQVITVFGQFGPAASPLWKKPHDKQCPFPWGSNYLLFVNYRWKAVPGKRSEWFVNLQHRISATGWLYYSWDVCPSPLSGYFQHGRQQKYLIRFGLSIFLIVTLSFVR